MLFNSFEFFIFLPSVFFLYWFVFDNNIKFQNFFLLICSYVFYGFWDYRFLLLLLFSTAIDFFSGLHIEKQNSKKMKRIFLYFSIFSNLSILGFFKYYNFFIDSWVSFFSIIGYEMKNIWTLKIILPVGISFYTFQSMSYTIDVYKKRIEPVTDFISFATFISFFPQLVAGPIERASNFLPQVLKSRKFNYLQAVQGLRLILWGLFKKIVIADSLAPIVNDIFSNYQELGGGILLLGAVYFSIQIYCDFSGYGYIAIGTAKIFGFELMHNFNFPYFSKNIKDFWRNWHISLSTWFKDYVFIPLGGSKINKFITSKNLFIVFVLSGLWHGAEWKYIFWGIYHSILLILFYYINFNYNIFKFDYLENKKYKCILVIFQIFFNFLFITIGWVLFRSRSLLDALNYLKIMILEFEFPDRKMFGIMVIFIFLVFEIIFFKSSKPILYFDNKILRRISYFILLFLILFSFQENNSDFIYFQF